MNRPVGRLAFVGMGEAGSAFVTGWHEAGGLPAAISAYDIKTDSAGTAAAQWALYDRLGIRGCESLEAALRDAQLVISVVTADQALEAAERAAPFLAPGALYCDMNSVSPETKRAAARAVGKGYVDVAILAPVHPGRHMVPLLVAGPRADEAAGCLRALPMNARAVGGEVGRASAIKMIRSVMVKGLEALCAECGLAAEAAGVADEVFGSLAASHAGFDWPGQVAYALERMQTHGARRAAEMEEVARTLSDLGLPADMARAAVRWQRRMAESAASGDGRKGEGAAIPALAAALRARAGGGAAG